MIETATVKRRRGRPPKDRQGFSETRQALLRSGMEILTEKGYSATGIDEILRQVGVPKGSFYHYFSSKEDFGIALITNYANFFQHKLEKFLTAPGLAPLQRLVAFMQDAGAGMASYQFRRGCLVGNLGQEMSALPESFREQLRKVFADWQQQVENCLLEAQALGQVAPQLDCRQSAYIFWIGWEGAVLRAKLERCDDALQAFAAFYLESLQ